MDKRLDHVVAKIFQRGPRKEACLVRPKQNRGLLPVNVRGERNQGAASMTYILPSWRKKLKGQLPDNVSGATKLDSINGSRIACANNTEIAAGADPSFPLEGR